MGINLIYSRLRHGIKRFFNLAFGLKGRDVSDSILEKKIKVLEEANRVLRERNRELSEKVEFLYKRNIEYAKRLQQR